MLSASKTLVICCALALCTTSVRADDAAELKPAVPCCGRTEGESPPVVGRDAASQAGRVNSDQSNCVCLKYIYSYWPDGSCDFYATDCFGSAFPWNEYCGARYPANCDANSCGTCFYYPQMPAPRAGRHDRPIAALPDHTVRPRLAEGSGASFFEEPFFVSVSVPGRERPLKAKVFPILVPRKELEGGVLPAQVFYSGVEISEFPEDGKARPVRGEALGPYGCRIIDHQRVLVIRTHTQVTD